MYNFDKNCDLYHVVDSNDKILGIGIEIALPGFNKENIDLKVFEDSVMISSETVPTNSEYRYVTHYNRINRSGFSVSFDIDKTSYDTSKMTASFTNGILALRIPVQNKPKARSIKIS